MYSFGTTSGVQACAQAAEIHQMPASKTIRCNAADAGNDDIDDGAAAVAAAAILRGDDDDDIFTRSVLNDECVRRVSACPRGPSGCR